MLPISSSPPSVVCAMEMPSWALRTATEMLAICDCSFSEIARPAASSFALLMRRQDDSRWT